MVIGERVGDNVFTNVAFPCVDVDVDIDIDVDVDIFQVRVLSIHNVYGSGNGVALNSLTEMRHFHYRGLGATSSVASQCNTTAPEGWLQKDEVAVLASRARKCPLGSSKVMCLYGAHNAQLTMRTVLVMRMSE